MADQKQVEVLHAWWQGDESVGLSGGSVELQGVGLMLGDKEAEALKVEFAAFIHDHISGDDYPEVMTGAELKTMNDAERMIEQDIEAEDTAIAEQVSAANEADIMHAVQIIAKGTGISTAEIDEVVKEMRLELKRAQESKAKAHAYAKDLQRMLLDM